MKSPVSLLNLWKTSEMEFSDRVDMILKKSHRKILSFDKVTAFDFFPFFFRQKCSIWFDLPSRPRGATHM